MQIESKIISIINDKLKNPIYDALYEINKLEEKWGKNIL
jgi:hypothetical protein